MRNKFTSFVSCLLLISLLSCNKKETVITPEPSNPEPAGNSSMKMEFVNMVDDNDLVFQKSYLNAKGDSFTVNKFIYYISNVVLRKADGSIFTEPESYHLIDHSISSSRTFTISKIPVGTYNSISFMLGVDSLRNVSGAQSGALDPAKGMFWTWNSGYIFFKMEGKSPKSPQNASYTFHVGGYKGANKAQRVFTIDMTASPLKITEGNTGTVSLKANAAEIFKNPTLIDLTTQYYQMSEGPQGKIFADNYADMFSLRSVQN